MEQGLQAVADAGPAGDEVVDKAAAEWAGRWQPARAEAVCARSVGTRCPMRRGSRAPS